MSRKLNLIPSEDVYEMWAERKLKKTKATKVKKGKSGVGPNGDTDFQEVVLPSWNRKKWGISTDTCAQGSYDSCAGQVEKLLFEGDEQILKGTGGMNKVVERAVEYSFQHYQVMLYLKKELGQMESALKETSLERDALLEEIGSSRKRWSEMKGALRDDLARKDEEISTLRSKMRAMKETLKAREEQIKDIVLETIVITRGQAYEEYMDGKASTWDTEKGIRQMRSALRARDGLPSDEEDEASGDGVGEGDDDEGAADGGNAGLA